jgi:hypothetical protein
MILGIQKRLACEMGGSDLNLGRFAHVWTWNTLPILSSSTPVAILAIFPIEPARSRLFNFAGGSWGTGHCHDLHTIVDLRERLKNVYCVDSVACLVIY